MKDGFRFFEKENSGGWSDLMAGSLKPGWGLSGTRCVGSGDCLLSWKLVLSPLASQVVMLMSLRALLPSPAPSVLSLNLIIGRKSFHTPSRAGQEMGKWGYREGPGWTARPR